MSNRTAVTVTAMIGALVIALFFWRVYKSVPTEPETLVMTSTTTSQLLSFPNIPIEAQSAYVYDALTGKVLFEKDASAERPLASLTKIMSALTASEVAPNYLDVTLTRADIEQEGDNGLYVDENWNIAKLLNFTLVTSSNDGIYAIAGAAGAQISSTSTTPVDLFVSKMNSLARQIGLQQTYFLNPSGLDISTTTSGGYGSAKDVVMLVDYILNHDPHLLEATTMSKMDVSSEQFMHVATNTDIAIPDIPNIIAS
ncbi:MAG: D-alanyl-D-alanine carboxypeptidase, partial [Patescibacteria group bacterium]|nr:D-alanyl-D-alanine carboxypeptidase [Patescibacteria group bacterium]